MISRVFFQVAQTLGEFFIFSMRGLPYCKPYSLPEEGYELVGCLLPTQSTASKASGGLVFPACQKVMWDLVQPPGPWQGGVTAANVTETPIRQMKLGWKLRRVANAVLSILKICPRYCKPQTT